MTSNEPDIFIHCDRYWLLTWTMYGNWLPGDKRGFVSNVRDGDGPEVRHNIPGTEFDKDLPSLEEHARTNLVGDPIRINLEQAEVLLPQFQETAAYRQWKLFAVAIMANHCHVVLGVPGDPEAKTLLQSLKSYGSRALNRQWEKPESGTWWTESGSKRKLPDEAAVLAAIQYVVDQEYPLVLWTTTVPELNLPGGRLK
jgi:REP element-mobilizing transposase RayT